MFILSAVLAWAIGGHAFSRDRTEEAETATVYVATNPDAIEGYAPNAPAIRRMVDRLVTAATGSDSPSAAWRSLVRPGGTVGIKVSTRGAPHFSTKFPVVAAVIEGLVSAGVPRSGIVVWDREADDLERAGFTRQSLGVRVVAGEARYLEEPVFTSMKLGRLIWGDREFRGDAGGLVTEETNPEAFSSNSHFAGVLAEVDRIINLPVVGDSLQVGLGGAIENLTLTNVDNWRRFGRPPDHGATDLPGMLFEDPLRDKAVLHLADALLVQYAGSPDFQPNYLVPFYRLYASLDPVALDRLLLDEVEALRDEAKLPPVSGMAKYIEVAGQMGLGVADRERIQLVEVAR